MLLLLTMQRLYPNVYSPKTSHTRSNPSRLSKDAITSLANGQGQGCICLVVYPPPQHIVPTKESSAAAQTIFLTHHLHLPPRGITSDLDAFLSSKDDKDRSRNRNPLLAEQQTALCCHETIHSALNHFRLWTRSVVHVSLHVSPATGYAGN